MLSEAIETLMRAGSSRKQTVDLPGGVTGVFLPPGHTLSQVQPEERQLTRIRQSAKFHDADSFIAYVNRFRLPGTQIFAEPGYLSEDGNPIIRAILDYHEAATPPDDAETQAAVADLGVSHRPDYGAHVATFRPRYSEEWQKWCARDVTRLKQVEFAEWIEETRVDIRSPEAASLMDIVANFKANRKQTYDSAVYQKNGDVKLAFSEQTEAVGSVTMPESFTIGIPVYALGPLYEVKIWIRYRVVSESKSVVFELKPDRPEYIERAAFKDYFERVSNETTVTPYIGSAT